MFDAYNCVLLIKIKHNQLTASKNQIMRDLKKELISRLQKERVALLEFNTSLRKLRNLDFLERKISIKEIDFRLEEISDRLSDIGRSLNEIL